MYTALPVALQPDFHRLTRYGWHIGLMCVLALAVFVFWPTSVSGAVGPRDAGGSFEMLYRIDTNGNACPSLHVAAAVFSVLWLRAILRQIRAPAWLGGLNWLWCLAIAYSTMAVKQHLLIDVLAGAALGCIVIGSMRLVTVNLAIGMFTPPFGINLFVSSSIFNAPMTRVIWGCVPFNFLYLGALGAITYIPQLSLWLPSFWQ